MSDSVWPQRRQPTRLPHPWDSPGKNTGVEYYCLLQFMKVKSEVAQSCPTLSNPMDHSLPGSSVHGISRQEYWNGVPLPSSFKYTLPYIKQITIKDLLYITAEKEMATHSSVLAWRIPGMGEPGGLPSMGSHRVGHDWSDLAAAAAAV